MIKKVFYQGYKGTITINKWYQNEPYFKENTVSIVVFFYFTMYFNATYFTNVSES